MRSLMMKRKVKKVFDYSKLRGKIKEVFGTQAKFAKAMGMSTVTLSAKLNGTASNMTLTEFCIPKLGGVSA